MMMVFLAFYFLQLYFSFCPIALYNKRITSILLFAIERKRNDFKKSFIAIVDDGSDLESLSRS